MTIIIPVHNAENALEGKLENCLALDYPLDQFEILVTADGCTDRSSDIAKNFAQAYPNVRFVESLDRIGKSEAQNRAASSSSSDILLLTDVDSMLEPDALRVLMDSFCRPTVGCVTGHVKWQAAGNQSRANSENLYWRFEHALWTRESALGVLGWASGPCMAIRRELFQGIDPRYGDDVVLPLDVSQQRAQVIYAPKLVVIDKSVAHPAAALRARARMTLRSFRGTVSKRDAFHPLRRPMLFCSIVSHKILRWITPVFFIATFVSAIPLSVGGSLAARVVLAGQCAVLSAAAVGYAATRLRLNIPFVGSVYELALENMGMLLGVLRVLLGHQEVAYTSEDR
ncbi:MAG TPA: glycosyltransferase [Streptosporangiaceae bacterium]|nr:glycosyltransferase [Streptosporangiaceae bacterium]